MAVNRYWSWIHNCIAHPLMGFSLLFHETYPKWVDDLHDWSAKKMMNEIDLFIMEGRSPKWSIVRKEHLVKEPSCRVCGRLTDLAVHHILPFHCYPTRELDPENLITLCDAPGGGCHFRFGHLWDWTSWNPTIVLDAIAWKAKVEQRPYTDNN